MKPPRLAHVLLTLAVSFVVVLAGCAGSEGGADAAAPTTDPVVLGPGPGSGAPPEPDDEELARIDRFQAMLDRAARHNVRAEYTAALGVIRRALAAGPPGELGPRFKALELRVKRRLLRESYLDAFVTFRRKWYTIGETIEGEIILMNVSNRRVTIPAMVLVDAPMTAAPTAGDEDARRAESRTVVRSLMTYREYLPTNTLITNKKAQNFRVGADIVLEPGEPHRIPVTFDTSEINVGATMFRTYTLSCSLHASSIRVGDEEFHGRLDFRPGVAGVFPRNAEHLADDPVTRMRQAIEKNSPLHLTLAAGFEERRGEPWSSDACRFLREQLERPALTDPLVDGVMTALLILSREDEKRSREEWVEWVKKRETRRR